MTGGLIRPRRHKTVRLVSAVLLLSLMGLSARAQAQPKIEIVPQIPHSDTVTTVALSPDGRRILSGSNDKTIKLWDIATGHLIRTFETHACGGVASAKFSPDGVQVLSAGYGSFTESGASACPGSRDENVKLWDAATGQLLRTFDDGSGWVHSVTFSPNGAHVLSYSESLKLWDASTGQLLRTFRGRSPIAFSSDGTRLLSGGDDNAIRLWEVATGKLLRMYKGASGTRSVAFSPDESQVLSVGKATVTIWAAASGVRLRNIGVRHSAEVDCCVIALSPDGTRVLSNGEYTDPTIKLWDVATGALLHTFEGHEATVGCCSVAFSPDGTRIASGGGYTDPTIKLWDAVSGSLLHSFEGRAGPVSSVSISPDHKSILSGNWRDENAKVWDAVTGRLMQRFKGHPGGVGSVVFSPDGTRIVSGSFFDGTINMWDVPTGNLLQTFKGHTTVPTGLAPNIESLAFSRDGDFVLSGGRDGTMRLWNPSNGQLLRTFRDPGGVTAVAFLPNAKQALSGSGDNALKLWDVATGRLLRKFQGHSRSIASVGSSPDGSRAISGGIDATIKLWNSNTGALLRTIQGDSEISSVTFSPDGSRVLSSSGNRLYGGKDSTLKLWDAATGQLLKTLKGHYGGVSSVAFSLDDKRIVSGGSDTTIRLWDSATNELLVSLISAYDGEWVAITPQGFFVASAGSGTLLSAVRGLDVTTIGQVHQSLFNPDLVREFLGGDPAGEVQAAAKVINLDKVVDSGPAPLVEIASASSKSDSDLVTVSARITDRGKGIGRVEWRMKGITVGVTNAPLEAGPVYEVKRELALDPGENAIEVVAYNARNLLASLPAQATIAYSGPADRAKPNLYVLAIGINEYVDRGWTEPGPDKGTYFPALNYAVADAAAFAEEMKRAGEGLYGRVQVRTALDEQAARDRLDRIVQEIAAQIQPRDTFVFFAAGHGYSNKQNGRFYLIPQDYQGGANPEALASGAIGQDNLQDWVANRIKAKKAIILLDTCRSGALTAGYTRSRIDERPSEAAVGRLHEATGRPVLTAAAAGENALEVGKLGHGVFTTALINALHHGDRDGNGLIEVTELAAYVEEHVPKLADGSEVRAAIAKRGPDDSDRQSAHFGTTGGDFSLVKRLP